MRIFTDARTSDSVDELWSCEHPSTYTLGQAGRREHILNPGQIPIIQSDRGGQVTWHGPGQIVVYTLVDLRRGGFGIRELVMRLELAVIDLLDSQGIKAVARRDAPGVYVDGAKIAALGLRVRKGCSYHGLSLNVDADLSPFAGINPCGFENLAVTKVVEHGVDLHKDSLLEELLICLKQRLCSKA